MDFTIEKDGNNLLTAEGEWSPPNLVSFKYSTSGPLEIPVARQVVMH